MFVLLRGVIGGALLLLAAGCGDDQLFAVSEDAGIRAADAGIEPQQNIRWFSTPSNGAITKSPQGGRYKVRMRVAAPVSVRGQGR